MSGAGIGEAIALTYAREGARLALCSRTARELETTAAEVARLGAQVVAAPVDVSQAKAVDEFVHRAVTELGRIDVLVNNAGVTHPHLPLLELPSSSGLECG